MIDAELMGRAIERRAQGGGRGAALQTQPVHHHVSIVRQRLRGEGCVLEWEDGLPPERVLIVSATMGEGHNATGRALEEAMKQLWPAVSVERVDILEVMGSWVGPLVRSIYSTTIEHTPGRTSSTTGCSTVTDGSPTRTSD